MQDILALIDRYFDLMYTCDVSRFDQVFHPNATLQTASDGAYKILTTEAYRDVLRQRKSPASQGAPRHDLIETIDRSSGESALAKVEVLINGVTYRDYLSLLRIDGGWRVVAKVYCSVAARRA